MCVSIAIWDNTPAGKYDTPVHDHHPDPLEGRHAVRRLPHGADPRTWLPIRAAITASAFLGPTLTISLGIPNACNRCHNDKAKGETPEWAEEQLRKWYGPRKDPPHFAHAIAAGRAGKPEGERLPRRSGAPQGRSADRAGKRDFAVGAAIRAKPASTTPPRA